ncbi:sugar-binding transcriptional regulator [Kroppenstedtia pulmonis]|uniref:sugar-binding transcriptional regulator n=1 Tax=Kroppenstedtia pulmonis TaxID=1380685 RepID=UPI001C2529C2|nr:sugar-binding domain-containing protein [Kroppenstedtia pulmonis]
MNKRSNNGHMSKGEFLERVARLYYVLGLSQQEIAEQLGVGRSSVARFLNEAREEGIIQFHIRSKLDIWRKHFVEKKLMERYKLKDCVVLKEECLKNHYFETLVSKYLDSIFPFQGTLGLGWGRTLYEVGRQIHLCESRPQLRIVQLSGSSGAKEDVVPASSVIQTWAQSLEAKPSFLPVPAIVENEKIKEVFLSDQSVSHVMEEMKQTSVAVVGIGHTGEDATIIASNLAPGVTSEELSQRSVGDIIFHFFDENGCFSYPALSKRVLGASTDLFLNIPSRVGIAYGEKKAQAITGALTGKLVNVLITTENTAKQLLKQSATRS